MQLYINVTNVKIIMFIELNDKDAYCTHENARNAKNVENIDAFMNMFQLKVTLSRNKVQMQYKKLYLSNRKSKQWTHAMIMLVERYCKTCMSSFLSTSCHDIYMYTWETSFNSFIIDSDFNLFFLTNYFVKMMQTVLQYSFLI